MRDNHDTPRAAGDPFASYLSDLSLDTSWLDDEMGDVEGPVGWVGRIGRHIIGQDQQGFVWRESHRTETAALDAFQALDRSITYAQEQPVT